MQFTKIRLTGLVVTELPIRGALPSDRYILKAADGLGPPEVDVSLAATRNVGSVYQGRRPQSREVILRVGLNPDHGQGETASEMRSTLYGLLTPGHSDIVQLDLLNGSDPTPVAVTSGYVKRLEIAPFSDSPEVQITIACVRPYLEAVNPLYVAPGGSQSAPEILNVGSAPSGFRMEVLFSSNLSSWTIFDETGKKLEFEHDFLAGDLLAFDTNPGQKGVWLTRDLITEPILYSLKSGSKWLSLYGGLNRFTTSSPDFTWGDVFYLPKYWGV